MDSDKPDTTPDQIDEAPQAPEARREDAYLEVAFGMEAGKKVRLTDTKIVIGRGDDADFQLDDLTVSRHHASVEPDGNGWLLKDLGSPNGSRVGGERVEEAPLAEGAAIEVGAMVLMFKYGTVPAAAESAGPMRERDTQELPVITAGPEALGPAPSKGSSPSMSPAEANVSRRRLLVPTPIIAQVVSWCVVLIVAAGGVYVMNALLDSSMAEFRAVAGTEGGETKKETRQARPTARRQRAAAAGTPPGEVALRETQDVAQTMFDEANTALAEGELEKAWKELNDIALRYPEFAPREGGSLPERIGALERLLSYRKTLDDARTVLDSGVTEPQELHRIASQLSIIPTTHEMFGEQAMELTRRVKERQKDVSNGEAGATEEVSAAPESVEADVVEETVEEEPVPAEEPAEEEKGESDEALDAARQAYRSGDFTRAANLLKSAAKEVSEEGEQERLQAMARRMEPFGGKYREGKKLADKRGKEKEAISALEDALSKDRTLFGSYTKRIRTALAQVHARLAERELQAGNYARARKHLNQARDRDASFSEVTKLENLISFRATSLLRQAKGNADHEAALKALNQVLVMAAPGSGAASEAATLKEKLAKAQ